MKLPGKNLVTFRLVINQDLSLTIPCIDCVTFALVMNNM